MSKKYEIINNEYVVTHSNGVTKVSLSCDKHKELLQDYCVKNTSVEEICLKYGFSRHTFEVYKRAMDFFRNTQIPVTDEEALELNEIDLAKLIVQRKALALERAQDLHIEILKENAENWVKFKTGVLTPFENAIKNAKVAPKLSVKPINKSNTERFFVITLSDLQLGLVADEKNLFRQKAWNTKKAVASLEALCQQIASDVKNDKVGYQGCKLLLCGDLIHGLRGTTEKGTQLEVDLYGESQCDAIFEVLITFITKIYSIFENLEIHTVKGNHDGFDHYPIMMAVKNYFKDNKFINFNVYSTRTAVFKIANTMVVLDHGASDKFKADIPANGKARESYIQSLLLSKSKEYSECNSCIFIQGDKHHYEQQEFNDFEFIMVGALPLGDKYSDNLNLNSRSRQNCFVIDSNGLKTVHHYYIDCCK